MAMRGFMICGAAAAVLTAIPILLTGCGVDGSPEGVDVSRLLQCVREARSSPTRPNCDVTIFGITNSIQFFAPLDEDGLVRLLDVAGNDFEYRIQRCHMVEDILRIIDDVRLVPRDDDIESSFRYIIEARCDGQSLRMFVTDAGHVSVDGQRFEPHREDWIERVFEYLASQLMEYGDSR